MRNKVLGSVMAVFLASALVLIGLSASQTATYEMGIAKAVGEGWRLVGSGFRQVVYLVRDHTLIAHILFAAAAILHCIAIAKHRGAGGKRTLIDRYLIRIYAAIAVLTITGIGSELLMHISPQTA